MACLCRQIRFCCFTPDHTWLQLAFFEVQGDGKKERNEEATLEIVLCPQQKEKMLMLWKIIFMVSCYYTLWSYRSSKKHPSKLDCSFDLIVIKMECLTFGMILKSFYHGFWPLIMITPAFIRLVAAWRI